MNKLTPYEQSLSEQLSDVPMPSEDAAWAHMNKLLDENNNDGFVGAMPYRRGCSVLPVLIAVLLIGGGIYFFTHQDMFRKKTPETTAENKASEKSSANEAGVVGKKKSTTEVQQINSQTSGDL